MDRILFSPYIRTRNEHERQGLRNRSGSGKKQERSKQHKRHVGPLSAFCWRLVFLGLDLFDVFFF